MSCVVLSSPWFGRNVGLDDVTSSSRLTLTSRHAKASELLRWTRSINLLTWTRRPGLLCRRSVLHKTRLIDSQGLSLGSDIKTGSNTVYGFEKLRVKKQILIPMGVFSAVQSCLSLITRRLKCPTAKTIKQKIQVRLAHWGGNVKLTSSSSCLSLAACGAVVSSLDSSNLHNLHFPPRARRPCALTECQAIKQSRLIELEVLRSPAVPQQCLPQPCPP